MTIRARDLMQTSVVTLAADEPVSEIERIFAEEEIHGAPVVDDQERLIGMVSTLDLVRAAVRDKETDRETPSEFEEIFEVARGEWDRFIEAYRERVKALVAEDVMTEGAISVETDAEVSEIARTMREARIHRVVVVEKGAVRGIISSFGLLAVLEKRSG
jgi:CBS domain-containing protein